MVPTGKDFRFRDRKDLIGKKGVTNAGESYGSDFDSFMAEKLTVSRSAGEDQAFKELLSGKVDYMIIGLYPGLAGAAKSGVKNQIETLEMPLLAADMFIAFSKKSPCLAQVEAFGRKLSAMRTDGSIEAIMEDATRTWDAAHR
jgi:polar amino acid transport system substrate-binding protein